MKRDKLVSFRMDSELYDKLCQYLPNRSISEFIYESIRMRYYLLFVLHDENFEEYMRIMSTLSNYNNYESKKRTQ